MQLKSLISFTRTWLTPPRLTGCQMPMEFEWDPDKEMENVRKHGVSFHEAQSVFGDPLSLTIPKENQDSSSQALLAPIDQQQHAIRSEVVELESLNAREATRHERTDYESGLQLMKDEYDFSKGVRGKYSERYKQGTNIVLLDPELRKSFPDDKAVNKALREFLELKKMNSS